MQRRDFLGAAAAMIFAPQFGRWFAPPRRGGLIVTAVRSISIDIDCGLRQPFLQYSGEIRGSVGTYKVGQTLTLRGFGLEPVRVAITDITDHGTTFKVSSLPLTPTEWLRRIPMPAYARTGKIAPAPFLLP